MPFPNIGPGELILILVIALIILGPGRLPEVASSLGKSVREFRKAATDVKDAASLEPPASTTSQSSTSQASTSSQASTPDSAPAPAPNQIQGSTEPNRLDDGEPAAAAASGEQQHGSASS
ncbi:MAG: twin-arginine translocase TatA/TatE family subunit [Chloroflexi bacterium]|nr:twin-arginine translocase TatA/TatE family subunit [Chloroflexota bacterium]